MESLLYWRACRQLAILAEAASAPKDLQADFSQRAQHVEKELCRLYGPDQGIFYAADGLCRQPDIWGMAYMLAIGFPLEASVRAAVERWLTEHQPEYLYRGQVCHLPGGGTWEKLLIDVAPGEYQNGAYWATASGWVWQVLQRTDPEGAGRLLSELLEDFREGGACECINRGYRKLAPICGQRHEHPGRPAGMAGAVLKYLREELYPC